MGESIAISSKEAAVLYRAHGLCTLPVSSSSKKPTIPSWKHLEHSLPSDGEIDLWYKENTGIGIITGLVSGNLEAIDVDTKNDNTGTLWSEYSEELRKRLPGVFDKLVIARTKSGGYHILFRCPEVEIPTHHPIAARDLTEKEMEEARKKNKAVRRDVVLIETRGEGGYVLANPSQGYEFIQNGPGSIPAITASQRREIHDAAAKFHTATRPVNFSERKYKYLRDAFDEAAKTPAVRKYDREYPILQLLEDYAGWEESRRREEKGKGLVIEVLRSGSSTNAKSGNILYPENGGNPTLVVHSTNTDFLVGKPYYASEALAVLKYDSDFEKAFSAIDRMYPELSSPSSKNFDWNELPPHVVEKRKSSVSLVQRPIYYREMIEQYEPPDWLIDGYMTKESTILIFGKQSAGKSFVAIDMALSICYKTPWAGNEIHAPGPVVYLAGEGRKGILKRTEAWRKANGIPEHDYPNFVSFELPIKLMDDQSMNLAGKALADAEAACGPLALVIIDTLHSSLGAGDENSSTDMGVVVERCRDIIRRFGCSVMIVHHTGKGDPYSPRGSSSLGGDVDFEYRMESSEKGSMVRLVPLKTKDSQLPPAVMLELESVDTGYVDRQGRPETSLVPKHLFEGSVDEVFGTEKTPKKSSKCFAVFQELEGESFDGSVSQKEFKDRYREKYGYSQAERTAVSKFWKAASEFGIFQSNPEAGELEDKRFTRTAAEQEEDQ